MAKHVRKITDDVISAVEDGFLSWETVANAALKYMSEDDVADMANINDWALFADEEEEDIEEEELEEEVAKPERTSFRTMYEAKKKSVPVPCPECGVPLEADGRCYNPDCDQYDPLSQYFDDEDEDNILDESQSQEIGDTYRRLSKYYGVDLNELIYGPNGFMATKYPDGFGISADIIYIEDKWDEFEQWMKEKHGIDFEAIREKNLEDSDDYEPRLTTDRMAAGQWYESLTEAIDVSSEILTDDALDKVDLSDYEDWLWGEVELEYSDIDIEVIPHWAEVAAGASNAVEPAWVNAESKTIHNYTYQANVEVTTFIEYVMNRYNIEVGKSTVGEFFDAVETLANNSKEVNIYLGELAEKFAEEAKEAAQASYEYDPFED